MCVPLRMIQTKIVLLFLLARMKTVKVNKRRLRGPLSDEMSSHLRVAETLLILSERHKRPSVELVWCDPDP